MCSKLFSKALKPLKIDFIDKAYIIEHIMWNVMNTIFTEPLLEFIALIFT